MEKNHLLIMALTFLTVAFYNINNPNSFALIGMAFFVLAIWNMKQ